MVPLPAASTTMAATESLTLPTRLNAFRDFGVSDTDTLVEPARIVRSAVPTTTGPFGLRLSFSRLAVAFETESPTMARPASELVSQELEPLRPDIAEPLPRHRGDRRRGCELVFQDRRLHARRRRVVAR